MWYSTVVVETDNGSGYMRILDVIAAWWDRVASPRVETFVALLFSGAFAVVVVWVVTFRAGGYWIAP